MKLTASLLSLSSLILSIGCVGPLDPPLGLGPGWDELAGVALVGLVATLAYQLIRKLVSAHRHASNAPSPMDVLNARYARGEISHEEYERIKERLS